ncbi:MAG: S8 family peptidase [Pseudonocardiaceae bacterium]
MPLRPRLRAPTVVCALLVGSVGLSAPAAQGVPVPGFPLPAACRSDGPELRYVVLFVPATPALLATSEVAGACGASSAYYPEIGVGVASSSDPAFADRIGRDRTYSAAAEALAGAATPDPAGRSSFPLERAEPRTSESTDVAPADRAAEQWDMAMIGATRSRAVAPGDPGVVVGVLDSGVDPDHPDLAAAIDPERSAGCLTGAPDPAPDSWVPTSSTHGTHVAGTIAAADDGKGIAGVAPGVRIASVKVVDDAGFIYPEYAVCGFMWAARQGMQVTNNSYFVDPWLFTCADQPGQAVAHEAVRRAVEFATGAGVLAVAAAGNERLDLSDPAEDVGSPSNRPDPRPRPVDDGCDVLPAELPGVIAVSAVGAQRVMSGYSSFGLGVVDVTAPGGDPEQASGVSSSGCVLSTVPGGYGYACGTSMASPHATGVAALLASTHPDADPDELTELLTTHADPIACSPLPAVVPAGEAAAPCQGAAANGFYGHGLVDALDAVTR